MGMASVLVAHVLCMPCGCHCRRASNFDGQASMRCLRSRAWPEQSLASLRSSRNDVWRIWLAAKQDPNDPIAATQVWADRRARALAEALAVPRGLTDCQEKILYRGLDAYLFDPHLFLESTRNPQMSGLFWAQAEIVAGTYRTRMRACAHPCGRRKGPGEDVFEALQPKGTRSSFREVRGTGKGAVLIRLETDVAGCRSLERPGRVVPRSSSAKKKPERA